MHRLFLAFLFSAPLSAAAYAVLRTSAPAWAGWPPASCMPYACFCELAQPGPGITQPANTLSSFLYVWAGVWMWLGRWPLRWTPGLAAIVIGLGSAFFHASLTFVGQFWDVFGMHAFIAFLLAWGFARWRGYTWWRIYVPVLALCTLLLWFVPETRRGLFALLLLAVIALEICLMRIGRGASDTRLFWAGLALFALAYAIWLLDNTHTACAPTSWLQGHAIWHALGAIASVLQFAYLAGGLHSVRGSLSPAMQAGMR